MALDSVNDRDVIHGSVKSTKQTDPKEGVHRATDMMRELSNGDWVFGWCLVSDLDLPLEFVVPRPLTCTEDRQS